MTLFEYLAIAYSLVLSLAAVRAASVLPYIFVRTRHYWVHTVWVFLNLTGCLVIFWNFWSYRDVTWTLGRFALVLALPTSVAVTTSIVAPDEPAKIDCWRSYFYTVRSKLFVATIAFCIVVLLVSTVILDIPLLHPLRLGQLGFLAACVAGALSERPRVHASIASLSIATFVFFVLWLLNAPGALSASG